MTWPNVKLGEHVVVQNGYAFKSEEYSEDNSGINICGGLIIFSGWIDWTKSNYWPKQKTENLDMV